MNDQNLPVLNLDYLLKTQGPVTLVIQAELKPADGRDTFQPTGFPQLGPVIYKAPRKSNDGWTEEAICIVDSPASMANHLEAVCTPSADGVHLHEDLTGLPYVICVTDAEDGEKVKLDERELKIHAVTTSLQEGHRIASDYFVHDVQARLIENDVIKEETLRSTLRSEFGLREIKRNEKYFVFPDSWWRIYKTIFERDPNSLIHGVLFAKEQIKISRLLSAHLDAYGAARVRSSGVKFDSLGITASGQPIFAKESETARSIRATFVLDLAMLRSYGRAKGGKGNEKQDKDEQQEIDAYFGLTPEQKRLLLELALWKVDQLLKKPFRFRSGCLLQSEVTAILVDGEKYGPALPALDITAAIKNCKFKNPVTRVYWPNGELFKSRGSEQSVPTGNAASSAPSDDDDSETDEQEEVG